MGFSFWEILILLVVVVIIFGAGRLPRVMGDLASGIKAFKKNMTEPDPPPPPPPAAQTPAPPPIIEPAAKDAGPKT